MGQTCLWRAASAWKSGNRYGPISGAALGATVWAWKSGSRDGPISGRQALPQTKEMDNAIWSPLRNAATVSGYHRRLERVVQRDAGTVRPGRQDGLRQSVVCGAPLPHRVLGFAGPSGPIR